MSEQQKILFEIYLDNGEFKIAAKDAADQLKNIGDESGKAGKKANESSGMFGKLTSGWLKQIIVGGTLIMTFKKVYDALLKAVQNASNLQETTNKFNVTFSKTKEKADAVAKSLQDMYGMSQNESKKFLSDSGDLLTGLGMTQEKALEVSEAITKLGTDLASFTNIEGGTARAVQALTSGLLGEREAMKALGIVINEEMVTNELRKQGKEKLTGLALQEAKAEATLALALEQSKNAIGDMERSYDSYANIQKRINSRLEDMSTTLGDELLPSLSNLGLAFLEASKDGGFLMNTFKQILKWTAEVINGFALLISYVNKWSSAYKNSENRATQKAYVELYKQQQQEIKKLYGSYEALEQKAKEGNQAAQHFLKSHLQTKDAALKASQNALSSAQQEKDAMDAILKIKERINNVDSNNNAAIDNRIKDRTSGGGNSGTPSASTGKQKEGDLVAFYASLRQEEDATFQQIEQNKLKDLANAKLLYDQKLITKQQYEQAQATLEEEYRQQRLEAEQMMHEQSVINDATAWQAKQQNHLAYLRASLGFESKAFQGTQMLAQAGMQLMGEKNKVLFNIGKASTIANIIMSASEAILKGMSYGPHIGIPYAALVGTTSALQLARVATQKPPEEPKLKNASFSMPSFAVGTWNVPTDMFANIHQGEMIIPKTFAESIRAGEGAITGPSGGNVYITVEGSIIDTLGLLSVVDDAQNKKASLMGAKTYNFKGAY